MKHRLPLKSRAGNRLALAAGTLIAVLGITGAAAAQNYVYVPPGSVPASSGYYTSDGYFVSSAPVRVYQSPPVYYAPSRSYYYNPPVTYYQSPPPVVYSPPTAYSSEVLGLRVGPLYLGF